MLLGEYNHSIDAKGRLNLPSKYRGDFGESVIITKSSGANKCLWVFSLDEWEKFIGKITQQKMSSTGKISRFFAAGGNEVAIDKQGRILIPQTLRDFAGLSKDVVIAGVMTKAEIWDKESYEEFSASIDGVDIEEAMKELDI